MSNLKGPNANIGGRKHFVAGEAVFGGDIQRPDSARIKWNNDHRNTNCRRHCRDHSEHFQVWKNTYESYLEKLYSVFARALKPSKASFSDFAEFAYSNSSGYISRYT